MLQQFLADNLSLAGFGATLIELIIGVPLVLVVLEELAWLFPPKKTNYTNLE